MFKFIKNMVGKVNIMLGFYFLIVVLFWLKIYIVYKSEFILGVKGFVQEFILFLNLFLIVIVLFGIVLYFCGCLKYWIMMIIDVLQMMWLFVNILYYWEFFDFMLVGVIKSFGVVSNNFGKSLGQIIYGIDFLVYVDVVLLILLLVFKVIWIDLWFFKIWYVVILIMIGVVLFVVDFGMFEYDCLDLLMWIFDNNYIVKYLGFNIYVGYSFYQIEKESVMCV